MTSASTAAGTLVGDLSMDHLLTVITQRSTDLPRRTRDQIRHPWALFHSAHCSLRHQLLYPRLPIYLASLSSSAVLIFWMVRAMYKECHVEGDQDEASEGPDPVVAFILSPSEQLHACLNQPNSVLQQGTDAQDSYRIQSSPCLSMSQHIPWSFKRLHMT